MTHQTQDVVYSPVDRACDHKR